MVKARELVVTAEGAEINVTVELRNPNDAPVELTTWNYSVIINDRTAYTGQWVASLTLPPRDRMLAELPAFVPASFGDVTGAEWQLRLLMSSPWNRRRIRSCSNYPTFLQRPTLGAVRQRPFWRWVDQQLTA